MTMMEYLLVQLRGNEDWDAWGDSWFSHVERVAEVDPGASLSSMREVRQLDWGAFLYEITREDALELARLTEQRDASDGCGAVARVSSTPPGTRFGVIQIECY